LYPFRTPFLTAERGARGTFSRLMPLESTSCVCALSVACAPDSNLFSLGLTACASPTVDARQRGWSRGRCALAVPAAVWPAIAGQAFGERAARQRAHTRKRVQPAAHAATRNCRTRDLTPDPRSGRSDKLKTKLFIRHRQLPPKPH